MGKTSTSNKTLTILSLILIIFNVFSVIVEFVSAFTIGIAEIDTMFICSSIFVSLFYIFMNWFTFQTLKNIGLFIYNFILFICVLINFYAIYLAQIKHILSIGIGGWALVIICANNLIFLIIDIIMFFVRKYSTNKQNPNNDCVADQVCVQNVTYPKDNVLKKETMTNAQDTIPNTQFIEPTNNQPIIQMQNAENHVDEQKVEHNKHDKVVENNITIDLNNLTPEQKDQLLIVLSQNNQKTNE